MSPDALTAVAALIAALGGCGSAVAAIISALRAGRSEKAAVEARELIKQVITLQQTTTQTNAQTVHLHLPTTVGANIPQPQKQLIAVSQEITFPEGEVPAIAPAVPTQAPAEAPQQVQTERVEE